MGEYMTLAFPIMEVEDQLKVEKFLRELGFIVHGGGMNIAQGRTDLYIEPGLLFCICCGKKLDYETFAKNKMCAYCWSGTCTDDGNMNYIAGHGKFKGKIPISKFI